MKVCGMLYSKQHEFVLIIFFLYIIKILNEATGWLYISIQVCVILIEMLSCYFYIYLFMVILRSTTGPYGRPIIEVAYGEILLFSLHRGCMGVKLGKSGWDVNMCRPC